MDSEPLITPETNSRQIPRDEGVKLEKSGTIYRGMPLLYDVKNQLKNSSEKTKMQNFDSNAYNSAIF